VNRRLGYSPRREALRCIVTVYRAQSINGE